MPKTTTHQPSEIPSSKTSVLTRTFQAHQAAISHACLAVFFVECQSSKREIRASMTTRGSQWIETEHPYPLWSIVVAIHTCDCHLKLSIRGGSHMSSNRFFLADGYTPENSFGTKKPRTYFPV